MLSLQSEIDSLCALSHELLYLGLDGEPIYSDRFRQLNTDVYHRCEHLFGSHGRTLEEEASLCIALLTGYNATIIITVIRKIKSSRFSIVVGISWIHFPSRF